jgi:hypothetical protein
MRNIRRPRIRWRIFSYSPNAYVAVLALTSAYCAVEINEAAYWAGTMRIAQGDSMAATGVLNTGGNIGGWIGIPLVDESKLLLEPTLAPNATAN